jgi:hypothetical protein
MTVSTETNPTVNGIKSNIRSVTFTHTAAGTAAGSATTPFSITGKLLRIAVDDGGDAAWDLTLTASGVTVWTETGLGAAALTRPLGFAYDGGTPIARTDVPMWGIPLCNEALTVTTANMSGSGAGPAITVIWEA